MRRSAAVLSGAVLSALLVAVPPASADEPVVRSDGDTVTYVDPALADEETTTVEGVLREVVVEHAPGDRDHSEGDEDEARTLLVTSDGRHLPVELDLGDTRVSGAEAVAELVDGPTLDAALDGEAARPVPVAEATFEDAEVRSAGVTHRTYVAIVENTGAMQSTATIEARVDAGLAWWTAESGASFVRSRTVRYSSSLTGGSTSPRCGLSSPQALWNEAAARFPDVDFGAAGVHLLVVVDDAGCSGTGIGTLGDGIDDGGAVTMTEDASVFTATVAHEIGHNVGLEHANLEAAEYWDLYSPMGLAVQGSHPPALDSEYRDQLGLDVTGEVEVVPPGAAVTRTLAARGSTSGLRGLEVRSGTTSHWVEWRPGSGRDAQAYYPEELGGTYVSSTRTYPPGVTVSTRATGSTGTTSLRPRTSGGVSYGAWAVGQTYTSGTLTVRVDAVTADGATVSVSNGAVLPEVVASTPTISGTAAVGRTLTAEPGAWEPGAALAYQWRADGSAISGATSRTYRAPAAVRGKRLSVRVTGTLAGRRPTVRTSAATVAVAYGTLTTAAPRISGTVKVGRRLSVVRGTWTAGTAFTYRWYANGRAISGATRSTYVPTKGVKGKRLTVKVTGRKTGYTTVARVSARTAAVR